MYLWQLQQLWHRLSAPPPITPSHVARSVAVWTRFTDTKDYIDRSLCHLSILKFVKKKACLGLYCLLALQRNICGSVCVYICASMCVFVLTISDLNCLS